MELDPLLTAGRRPEINHHKRGFRCGGNDGGINDMMLPGHQALVTEPWRIVVRSNESVYVPPKKARVIEISKVEVIGDMTPHSNVLIRRERKKPDPYPPVFDPKADPSAPTSVSIIGSLARDKKVSHLALRCGKKEKIRVSHTWGDGSLVFCGFYIKIEDSDDEDSDDVKKTDVKQMRSNSRFSKHSKRTFKTSKPV